MSLIELLLKSVKVMVSWVLLRFGTWVSLLLESSIVVNNEPDKKSSVRYVRLQSFKQRLVSCGVIGGNWCSSVCRILTEDSCGSIAYKSPMFVILQVQYFSKPGDTFLVLPGRRNATACPAWRRLGLPCAALPGQARRAQTHALGR